ncbi:MAG: hypothetical protein ABJC33_12300 [Betaproteobacteria bacterium]
MSTESIEKAFPGGGMTGQPGMPLRDYFAAAALTGLCGAENTRQSASLRSTQESTAVLAYAFADAMLAARGNVATQ